MQLVLDVVTGEDFPAGRTIQIGLRPEPKLTWCTAVTSRQ